MMAETLAHWVTPDVAPCGHDPRFLNGSECTVCKIEAQGAEIEALKVKLRMLAEKFDAFRQVVRRHTDGLLAALVKDAERRKENGNAVNND
jgi:hypothetical protein